jgi:hypothetical protein
MERAKLISHEGKQILFLDYSNSSIEHVLQVIAEGTELIRAQPLKSVLILNDFTNSTSDPKLLAAIRAFTAGNEPYVKASAIFGLGRVAKVFYDIIIQFTGRRIQIFADANQAKDWLIAQ